MRFYLEGRNATNKSCLFYAKFFEFEEFSQAPFFWVASCLSTLCSELAFINQFQFPMLLNYMYRGSPLSTIFGILKKPYYAKFVLVSTTYPISTSTVYSTQKFHQYGFQYIALKNRTSGNRTTGDRTSRGPPVYINYKLPTKLCRLTHHLGA